MSNHIPSAASLKEARAKDLPSLADLNYLFELASEGSGLRWKVDRGPRKLAGKLAGSRDADSNGKQYWQVGISGQRYLAHRIVYALANDQLPPPELQIDHINGDGLDNRPSNLRLATNQQNGRNRQGAHRNSKSGILGVYEIKQTGRWRARIWVDGRAMNLGYFSDKLDARLERYFAELEHGHRDGGETA